MTREEAEIRAGLQSIGIGAACEIVAVPDGDRIEGTAIKVLERFLGKAGIKTRIVPPSASVGDTRILLGRDTCHEAITRMCDSGKIRIRDVSPEDDGFHLGLVGRDIVIAGANPCGVLYGVFELEDYVRAGARGPLDIRKVPFYRKRGSGLHYSFNPHVEFVAESHLEEKVEYLARTGINQLTDQGISGDIQCLVHSDVFPFETPPKPEYQRQVRKLSALCRDFGIEHYVWLQMPNLAADAELYPSEALGKVKRPWGGGPDGMDTTLCVNSPIVRDHLRGMVRQLVREYPDVAGILLYNLDGRHWLCTPRYCDRCRAVCDDQSQGNFTPWETQASLVNLLADAAHEENPGFEIMLWGAVHYHGKNFDKMVHAARGYGRLLSCWNASDRSVMVPAIAEPDPAFVLSQEICAERGVPFHAIFEFNNLESVPKSLPFPFHVCDALRRFARWGARNLTEIYGLVPEHNSINALVMKEFQWDPERDVGAFLVGLARRQFGPEAGERMFRAWEEMRAAFDVWNDMSFGPLDGSQHILSIGTAVALPPPALPAVVMDRNSWKNLDKMLGILTNVEPWREKEYRQFKEKAFADKMDAMAVHLSRAAEHARQAVAEASDAEFVDVCHYDGGNGRQVRRHYAELNWSSIAIAGNVCRQRVNMLRAYHLLTELETLRASGEIASAGAVETLYRDLLRGDIELSGHFADLLTGFLAMRPCLTRTGMTEREMEGNLTAIRGKIGQLQDYLGNMRS